MMLTVACAAVLFGAAGPTQAAAQAESPLVSPAWLAARLTDPNLVLLHLSSQAEFDAAHLPGARFVTLNHVSTKHTPGELMLEMLPAEELRRQLEALGISDRSTVVVYFGRQSVSPTTRVLLTLQYAGLGDRSFMLDGGMPAWVSEGRPVTTEVAPFQPGRLSPLALRPVTTDAETVVSRMKEPGVSIVDARASVFYDGVQTGGPPGSPDKTGHIAGARSVPYTSVVDAENRMLPVADLRALFTAAGVKPGDTVIAYCHLGQQATIVVLAARLLGHPVMLYDGSFEDWSRRDLPVSKTPGGTSWSAVRR
jgi:thiosulfate/3-mercaptopyruvate sulfurtransferase